MALIDLTERSFGRLRVASRAENAPNWQPRWRCICECGKSVTVLGSSLREGRSRSCGCLRREVSTVRRNQLRHGHATKVGVSSTYRTWMAMVQRCTNPARKDYKNYGGRGITICKRWHVFDNFLADMGERPEGCSIVRRNNSKGYTKANCRWSTPKEQANNRR